MAFFSHLARRSLSQKAATSNAIKNVTVVGSGCMGAGIAQVAAQTGHSVTVVDIDPVAVEKAQKRIADSIGRVAKKKFGDGDEANKFISESFNRLRISTDVVASVETADLVVEAIVENLKLKTELFSTLDNAAPAHTIFASNTSSLSIEKLAEATNRKDRFGGLHFFNPVPMMKLLEVVSTPHTSQDTIAAMTAWGKAMEKKVVHCTDTPGFIVNRLVAPFLITAVRLLERGVASKEDIDSAIKLGVGHPMGPLELLDMIGLDTTASICDEFSARCPDEPELRKPALLAKLVAEGKLGQKAKEGIFKYE